MLDEPLLDPLTTSVVDPPTSSASAAPEHTSTSSDNASNSTALGVVGMLRRLKLWTEKDAKNGKLTILPSSIAAWLRSTGRYCIENLFMHFLLASLQIATVQVPLLCSSLGTFCPCICLLCILWLPGYSMLCRHQVGFAVRLAFGLHIYLLTCLERPLGPSGGDWQYTLHCIYPCSVTLTENFAIVSLSTCECC